MLVFKNHSLIGVWGAVLLLMVAACTENNLDKSEADVFLETTSINMPQVEIVDFEGTCSGDGSIECQSDATCAAQFAGFCVINPTSGKATVMGHVPWKRENAYRRRFALVMGQKNQLCSCQPDSPASKLAGVFPTVARYVVQETLCSCQRLKRYRSGN